MRHWLASQMGAYHCRKSPGIARAFAWPQCSMWVWMRNWIAASWPHVYLHIWATLLHSNLEAVKVLQHKERATQGQIRRESKNPYHIDISAMSSLLQIPSQKMDVVIPDTDFTCPGAAPGQVWLCVKRAGFLTLCDPAAAAESITACSKQAILPFREDNDTWTSLGRIFPVGQYSDHIFLLTCILTKNDIDWNIYLKISFVI